MNTNPKALFTSIYYGQKIFRYGEYDEQTYEISGLQIDGIADSEIGYPDCFLELRSVSDLMDDECSNMVNILLDKDFVTPIELLRWDDRIRYIFNRQPHITYAEVEVDMILDIMMSNQIVYRWEHKSERGIVNDDQRLYNAYAIYDYLRAIGILLPFTYLTETGPITLSTEEIIKNGWAIIIKENANK